MSTTKLEIALTGATGFIGSRLISLLVHRGWHVRALYRPKKGRTQPKLPGVTWVAGDLSNPQLLRDFVKGTHTVIHCAGVVRGATQEDFDKVNEQGALNVAEAAAEQSIAPRFLLISSLAARESQLSYYAGSKWRGECALKKVAKNLRWTILRPPAVYGPGDKELLPLFRSIANGFAPTPAVKNSSISMIYVDDLALAIIAWLEADSGYGQTFELDDGFQGGYNWANILEIGSRVLRDGGKVRRIQIPIFIFNIVAKINLFAATLFSYAPMLTPGKVREIIHPDWLADNKAFRQVIDWQPQYNLQRGLATIFNKDDKSKGG
ncbi:NAD-dependent epimerase/dehydratase family protein [Psychromonas sp. MME2]|uniref:NAD-dependent epimerase/dehydratase family protein n=1 Tax=unclassified Psychromonas TaxID=2614957 RepID=UPI00339C0D01